MSEKSIREAHEKLEQIKWTQSVKIVNEVKSDAHRDRGELLELLLGYHDAIKSYKLVGAGTG